MQVLISVLVIAFLVASVIAIVLLAQASTEAARVRGLSAAAEPLAASSAVCPLDATSLVVDLERLRARLLVEAARRTSVDWPVYAAAPATHAGRRVLLRQSDFANGTLRLRTTGVFALAEDIAFAPNAHADYRVDYAHQPEYAVGTCRPHTPGSLAARTGTRPSKPSGSASLPRSPSRRPTS